LALEQISLIYLALNFLNFLIWHRVKIFFCKWYYRPFSASIRQLAALILSCFFPKYQNAPLYLLAAGGSSPAQELAEARRPLTPDSADQRRRDALGVSRPPALAPARSGGAVSPPDASAKPRRGGRDGASSATAVHAQRASWRGGGRRRAASLSRDDAMALKLDATPVMWLRAWDERRLC